MLQMRYRQVAFGSALLWLVSGAAVIDLKPLEAFIMPAVIEYTDPTTHPSFMREQREITAILVRSMVSRGRPEHEALREAEAILAPIPAKRESSWRRFVASCSLGA
jgi:hypothetical protein